MDITWLFEQTNWVKFIDGISLFDLLSFIFWLNIVKFLSVGCVLNHKTKLL